VLKVRMRRHPGSGEMKKCLEEKERGISNQEKTHRPAAGTRLFLRKTESNALMAGKNRLGYKS